MIAKETKLQEAEDAKTEKDAAGNTGGDAAAAAAATAVEAKQKELEKSKCCEPAAAALLSIPLIAFAEPLGSGMCSRIFEHVLQYCNLKLRRIVPLCIGLLHVSRPQIEAIDLLSKLSHDGDKEVALSAVFCLGLVGAGTNHAKIAGLLRQLAAYYAKDANLLFVVSYCYC